MGYACPVCGTPQADGRHLADHLAMRAITHGDDHEDWLDEHVPDWAERGPADLGPAVAEEAAETDYPQVFEDTTGGTHDHDHGQGEGHDHGPDRGETLEDHLARGGRRGPGAGGRGDLTDERAAIVAEAREMTREMMEGGDPDGDTAPDPESADEGPMDRDDEERADAEDGGDRDRENDGEDDG